MAAATEIPAEPIPRSETLPVTSTEPGEAATGNQKGYVVALDPLRGLAALAVAFFHFTHYGWLAPGHWLLNVGYIGHHGIRLFFVISGFVVPYAMWRGAYRMESALPFLARRFVRIYPPYLLCLFVVAAADAVLRQGVLPAAWWQDLAAHLFLGNELLHLPWFMQIYWTLALEIQFYLVAALAWPLLIARQSALFALGAALVVWLGAQDACEHCLPYQSVYFLVGIVIFRLHILPEQKWIHLCTLAALLAAAGYQDGAMAGVAASIPYLAERTVKSVPAVGRFLGRISYSLYLFHMPAGSLLITLLSPYAKAWGMAGEIMLITGAIVMAVLAARLAYRIIEAPSIEWSRSFQYQK